jgi:hypothetical protein
MDRSIQVNIFTATHRILGHITPGAPGLFSYLNRPTESYVEIEDGLLSPLHQITEEGDSCKQLWLVKTEIAALMVGGRSELGPGGATRAGYTKPFPHWVRILLGGYELRGLIESGARFDFGALLFEGDVRFVPLYNASLAAILFPRVQSDAAAMVFNRSMVHGINLLPREEIPSYD